MHAMLWSEFAIRSHTAYFSKSISSVGDGVQNGWFLTSAECAKPADRVPECLLSIGEVWGSNTRSSKTNDYVMSRGRVPARKLTSHYHAHSAGSLLADRQDQRIDNEHSGSDQGLAPHILLLQRLPGTRYFPQPCRLRLLLYGYAACSPAFAMIIAGVCSFCIWKGLGL